MVLTLWARKERAKQKKQPHWKGTLRKRGSGEFWNDTCLRGRACWEAGRGLLSGRGPLLPQGPSHRGLRGATSYWNFFPLENFSQLSFSLVHSESDSSEMWRKPEDVLCSRWLKSVAHNTREVSILGIVLRQVTWLGLPVTALQSLSPALATLDRESSRFFSPFLIECAGLASLFSGISTAQSLESLGNGTF